MFDFEWAVYMFAKPDRLKGVLIVVDRVQGKPNMTMPLYPCFLKQIGSKYQHDCVLTHKLELRLSLSFGNSLLK